MLASDLLDQAKHLATVDPGRPRQANLRRSISSAYYALFHLLSAECFRRLSPRNPPQLGPRIGRALTHGEMKQVCRSISSGNRSEVLTELLPDGFSAQLKRVAEIFVMLQEIRHAADYDTSITFTRVATLDVSEATEEAFQVWRAVRASDEANVFLAALLFAGRWSK